MKDFGAAGVSSWQLRWIFYHGGCAVLPGRHGPVRVAALSALHQTELEPGEARALALPELIAVLITSSCRHGSWQPRQLSHKTKFFNHMAPAWRFCSTYTRATKAGQGQLQPRWSSVA